MVRARAALSTAVTEACPNEVALEVLSCGGFRWGDSYRPEATQANAVFSRRILRFDHFRHQNRLV